MAMEYRQLGGSDIRASVITYGAWAIGGSMWGGTEEQKAVEAIQASIDLGITSIDTAPLYGFGKSEELVGRAVAGRRDHVQLFTKFGLRADTTEGEYFFDMKEGGASIPVYRNARRKSIFDECETSLKWLGTDYIDLYQCHWRDHTTPVEDMMDALAELIEQGKIRAAGVSNFAIDEIEAAAKAAPLASDQPPYSMVNRDIEADVLPYCQAHNIAVIVYSPLQRGLLTGKFSPSHVFAPDDHRASQPHFRPENIRRISAFLDSLRPIADGHGATLGQLVINWTIHRPGVTVALVGARDAAQARENAAAVSFTLTDEEVGRIDALLDNLKLEL